jgi:quercetin dioxygenase-like cupin family protein
VAKHAPLKDVSRATALVPRTSSASTFAIDSRIMATTKRGSRKQTFERVPGIAAPIVKVCLGNAVKTLQRDPAWEHGRSSRTLAKYPDFRAVLIAMKAGTTMEEHKTEGSISVHTLTGHVRLHAGKETVDIPADHVVMLYSDLPHSVEAVADSSFLLTMVWHEPAES